MLMEMAHSAQRSPVLARELSVRHAYRKLSFTIAGIAPVLLLLIFVGGGLIFFILPRVSAGYLNSYAGANDLTSGFSDRVELGRIGQIQQSKTVVMHVQVDGDTAGAFSLKLRGIALNNFDGRNWSNTRDRFPLGRGADGRFDLWTRNPQPVKGRTVHYRVTMEPFLSEVFFLMARPQSLQGNYRTVSVDTAEDVFDLDVEHPVTRYEADSDFRRPDAARLRQSSGGFPADALLNNLQLPALDPRIKLLAEQISAKASGPYAKAAAIADYLRLHYGYTLQLPSSTPRDPIANFLFVRRQGHCEYFASSMAIMLRTLGIPSRVVNGFSGGEFNDITSQYVIRASDAHSWVEAYIPGEGWMEFDPTPSSGYQAQTQWSRFMLYMDAMSSFWSEWIVNYDLGHQIRLTQDASRGSRAVVAQAQLWGRKQYQRMLAWASRTEDQVGDSTVKWGVRVLAIFFLGLIVASIPRMIALVRRFRIARRPQKSPQMAASIWYERMLRQAARRGWEKSPAQTPEEFAAAIADPKLKEKVYGFTEHYENARFGASVEEASRLPKLYEEIKSSR
jgi:transglutaminase-like putative cysteine protease